MLWDTALYDNPANILDNPVVLQRAHGFAFMKFFRNKALKVTKTVKKILSELNTSANYADGTA